jgi:hypothetical protein
MRAISKIQVTIPSGTALSNAADLRFTDLVGVNMPSGWDDAALTFAVSEDGTTYRSLADSTGEYTVLAPAANQHVILSALDMIGIRFIQVRSGASATPVNQTADRVIELVTRELD